MKLTLLELTQRVLASLGSDEVNSINDTVESQQVAELIRDVYFDIIYRANLPEHYDLIALNAYNDNDKPVLMTVPASINKLMWIKYDCREETDDPVNMKEVKLLPLNDLLIMMYQADPEEDNVGSFTHAVNGTDFTFYYYNDKCPEYYSSIDDNTLIFDSYDSSLDTTLQQSKSMVMARLEPTFTLSDVFTPDLDSEQFNLLLNDSKSLAWNELKQAPHPIAERNSRRAWTHLQNNKSRSGSLSNFDTLPNFGRN